MWMKRKVSHEEDKLKIACFAYCEGKPFWWRWFYGWRLTDREGCVFNLTEKAWNNLFELCGSPKNFGQNFFSDNAQKSRIKKPFF